MDVPASLRSRRMAAPTGEPAQPHSMRDGGTRAALLVDGAGAKINDSAGDDEEKHPVPAHILSVEAMEDLVLEAFMNMQSDGESIFLPTDVSSKLQYFARLVKGVGYVSDDDEIVSDTSQEEATRARLPSDHHTVSREASSSARSSPSSDYFSLADDELIPHVSRLQLDDHQQSSPTRHDERTPIEPKNDENTLSAAASDHAGDYRPAASRLEKGTQGLLSMSDAGSPTARPQKAPKSILRKSEVERVISVPQRRSVRFLDSETPTTRSDTSRLKIDSKQPPSPRKLSPSPWREQRCEDIEKRRQEKARREQQVQEAARKQRAELRRMIEESQEKNRAADRERLTRLHKKVHERSPLSIKNR